MAGCQKGQAAANFKQQWITEMLNYLRGAGADNESKETAEWAYHQIQDAMQAAGFNAMQ